MIIRKPYAFLIKHFKKIHILLLAFAVYIYFKTTQTYSFVREFLSLGTYDILNESITKYVSPLSIIILIAVILISIILIRLLKRKEKPWKLYLVPAIQYSIILLAFIITRNFFHSFTGAESTTQIRIWRDLLGISQITQLGTFLIYIIRIFGIDLNKFNFKFDEEYLELEQKDREELEISLNIDKSSFKRFYKKTIRNLNYFYQEHKFICKIAIFIFILIISKTSFDYITSHRSYAQGNEFEISGYTVKINNSYYTDKAYNGEVISDKSSFVIVDLTITNNYQERTPNLNRYHIVNGTSNYTTTEKTYAEEFRDLGTAYEKVTLKRNKSVNMIMIYKVNKKLDKNKFVLYFQEFGKNNSKYLRKIKLNIKDLSKIKTKKDFSLGDTMNVELVDDEENITFEEYSLNDSIEYSYKNCLSTSCITNKEIVNAKSGSKILYMEFGSDKFDGKDMTTLMEDNGKIIYKNANDEEKTIDMKSAITRAYSGKYLYVTVPQELENAKEINLVFILRNNKYIYKLK